MAASKYRLTACRVLTLGDPLSNIGKRQANQPFQHNISEIITPATTGRWTASIDAQLQRVHSADDLSPKCTLSICTGPVLCSAAKEIGNSWSKFLLKVQLRANQAQTISFVATCSKTAYVAVRNILFPGQGTAATVTAIQTVLATAPASTIVSSVTSFATTNAALGLAGSVALINNCERTWMTIYGDDDFEHIPPQGLAIVPKRPNDRFGQLTQILSQGFPDSFCIYSGEKGKIGCFYGTVFLQKRQGPSGSPSHSTHPLDLNTVSGYKFDQFDGLGFRDNDIVSINCNSEPFVPIDNLPQTQITISLTGCDGFAGAVLHSGAGFISLAYAGNTVANVTVPYPSTLNAQVWSRNEPGWFEGTKLSIDGGLLQNAASVRYDIQDADTHTFAFVCNYATRDPPGLMTQVVYSTVSSISTETDMQWTTFTQTDTQTDTATETETSTLTATETQSVTETKTQMTACSVETTSSVTTTETGSSSTSTSESTSDSTSSETPSPSPNPAPAPQPQPQPRQFWQVNVYSVCRYGLQPVIISQPDLSPDGMFFTKWDSVGMGLYSDVPYPSFEAVAGGPICVSSSNTGQQWCGDGRVTALATSNMERLNVDCPDPRPTPPDFTNSIPLQVSLNAVNSGGSVANCGNVAIQIGCNGEDYCVGYGYENNGRENDQIYLSYPISQTSTAKLRFKMSGVARSEWYIYYYTSNPNGSPFVTSQGVNPQRNEWVYASGIPPDTVSIRLMGGCYYY